MRYFIILPIVLTLFSVPLLVSAQTCSPACTGGASCTYDSFGGPVCVGGGNPGQGSNPSGSVTLINPLKAGTSIETFLGNILDFVIRIGSIVVILMIVFVGYKFVVAQGKPDKIEEAKKMLLWTIIGALVLLGAKAIKDGILATVTALGG